MDTYTDGRYNEIQKVQEARNIKSISIYEVYSRYLHKKILGEYNELKQKKIKEYIQALSKEDVCLILEKLKVPRGTKNLLDFQRGIEIIFQDQFTKIGLRKRTKLISCIKEYISNN